MRTDITSGGTFPATPNESAPAPRVTQRRS